MPVIDTNALQKLTKLLAGETVIVGDQELDAIADHLGTDDSDAAARYFRDLVTSPNPGRVGVRDAYVAHLRPVTPTLWR